MTYAETALEFEPVVDDLAGLLTAERLLAVAGRATWAAGPPTEGTVATATLDNSLLKRPRAANSAFDMGLSLGGDILEIRAAVTLDGAGQLASMSFSVDRSDPLAGLVMRRGGNANAPTSAPGSTRTYQMRPSDQPVGKRGTRLRLELLSAIAESTREGDPEAKRSPPGNPRPPSAPAPAATPRERAKVSFQATIAKVDADKDGQISQIEAGDRWARLGKYDTDADGHVTLDELLAADDLKQEAKRPTSEGGNAGER